MSETTNETRRPGGRAADALRPVAIELGAMKYAHGSALIRVGETRVLTAATVENRVPFFLKDSGRGWLTAEYAMLPCATHTRGEREVQRGRPSGRSQEIQRLIGRGLRAALDMKALGERTVVVDCDVIQADGGTRTAALTGAYVAVVEALGRFYLMGELAAWPVACRMAAVSVGLVDGVPLLDLEYAEDRIAEVDMNIVASADGRLVEIQGTGEQRSFRRDELDAMIDLALDGVTRLAAAQDEALAEVLAQVAAVRDKGSRRPAPPKDERELWGPP